MEYLLFRTLRLIRREIETYKDLYNCLTDQHTNIVEGNVLDLLVNMIDQKEILNTITSIERDVKEEIYDLTTELQIKAQEPTVTTIVNALEKQYPKLCDIFKVMGKNINCLLSKIERINKENISLLQNHKTIWKDIMPLYNSWKEFEPLHDNDEIKVEEPVYEFNLN